MTVVLRSVGAFLPTSFASVEFLDGETLLGQPASSPYSYSWTNPTTGTHKVTARATDEAGAARRSPISLKLEYY